MTAPRLITSIFAIVLAGTAGCSNDSGPVTPPVTQGTISGKATDVMGRPLIGVNIATTPPTLNATSGSDGTFSIPNVTAGTYTVRFVHPSFDTASVSATVIAGQSSTAELALKERGLVAAWSFTGSARDMAERGHDGVVTGASPAPDRFGVAASALQFEGDDFVTVAHADDLVFSTSDFSVAAWVLLAGSQENFAGILSKCTPLAPEYGYQLVIRDPDRFGIQIGSRVPTGQSYFDALATGSLTTNGWHFVCMVVSRGDRSVRLYVDGQPAGVQVSQHLDYSLMEDEPLYFGRERQGVRWFNGLIDDVRMFNRALAPVEVATLATR
jgi:hypothetical protein